MSIKWLEKIGCFSVGRCTRTNQIAIGIASDLGTMAAEVPEGRAVELALAVIRETGQVRDFSAEVAHPMAPTEEVRCETVDGPDVPGDDDGPGDGRCRSTRLGGIGDRIDPAYDPAEGSD